MTSKQKVLRVLEQNRGQYISGEELARQLSISRSGVWKAIKELEKEGYRISAVTNRGYCLSEINDMLSVEGILPFLRNKPDPETIHVHKVLDSTNREAKRLAVSGAANGTVVLAEEQTSGRGRLGRSFYSPPGSGIYMSVILHPEVSAEKSVLVTTASSLAVCRAVESLTGQRCDIKWVNDIYCRQRKICGILTEAVTNFETGEIESVVLGIGINFRRRDDDFPEDIRGKAGAVFQEETGGVTRNHLVAEILNELGQLDEMLRTGNFIAEYKARSLVLGKTVTLLSGGKERRAVVRDIGGSGALLVTYEDGTQGEISTGEVSVRGLFEKE